MSEFYKTVTFCEGLTLYQTTKLLSWSKLKALSCRQLIECLLQGGKHGKRRKCCLPAFSPFPTVFFRRLIFTNMEKKALKTQYR